MSEEKVARAGSRSQAYPDGMRVPISSISRLWAFLTCLALSAPLGAPAMTVVPPTFSKLVDHATQILRVEVVGSSSRWDTSAAGRMIHTYVQCSIQRTLKGDTASSITLMFLGGTVGDDHIEVPGLPKLEVGHTYILFVAGNGQMFCPIVAGAHGTYPIITDDATKAQTVLRANLQPLVSVDDVSRPLRAGGLTQGGGLGAAGLSREAFENSIVSEINRAVAQ